MHHILAEADAFDRAGPEVLYEDVRGFYQFPQYVRAGGLLEIERQGFLAPITGEEGGWDADIALVAVAHLLARQRLDLDDLRALIGEQHGRDRTGHHAGQVDDADTR